MRKRLGSNYSLAQTVNIKNKLTKANGFYHWGRDSVYCRKCKRRQAGDTFVDERKSVDSIEQNEDGTYKQAYSVLWVCGQDWHHIHKAGYTRPVDFNRMHPKKDQTVSDTDVPDIGASEKDWEDWAWVQQLKAEEANKTKLQLVM